jgi:hypothetical protein
MKERTRMKEQIKRYGTKAATMIAIGMMTIQLFINQVYAAGIANNKLFTGTKKMFNDLKTPLIGLSAVIAVAIIIYYLIRMKMADDMDAKMYKKRIFTVLGCCVLIVVIASLLTAILSYYK